MKYSPSHYAAALSAAAENAKTPDAQKKIVENFLSLLKKNGDRVLLKKILPIAEARILKAEGKRKITLESARELPLRSMLKKFLHASDVVEERINPELVAGVRITIDDEEQFDGSLRRKINKLFNA